MKIYACSGYSDYMCGNVDTFNIGVGQEWQSTIPERLTSVHLVFYPATQKSTSQLDRNCDSMSIYLATTL